MQTVTWQPIKNLNFFEFSRVSPGAHPLTKKPEDSGYEIVEISRSTKDLQKMPLGKLSFYAYVFSRKQRANQRKKIQGNVC